MNKLKLNIVDKGNSLEEPEYYLDLIIDGEIFLKEIDEDFNVVYFDALKKSLNKGGLYLIFTCSCGVADCGGWDYIKVEHNSSKIIWDFNYEKNYHFEFNLENYKSEIEKIESQLKQKELKLEPKFVVKSTI
ncbi:hypothetical protein [Aquimarina algiphila]|uniref:hypothetical protein n=1 Tax=Aquimarina algiphila TaxID=2047982 RepID=UPI00233103EC|nr:hypothetical protein [Aquimarina algiphila]